MQTPGVCAEWAGDAWPRVLAAAGGALPTSHDEAKQRRHVCPGAPWAEGPCPGDREPKLPVFKRPINKAFGGVRNLLCMFV